MVAARKSSPACRSSKAPKRYLARSHSRLVNKHVGTSGTRPVTRNSSLLLMLPPPSFSFSWSDSSSSPVPSSPSLPLSSFSSSCSVYSGCCPSTALNVFSAALSAFLIKAAALRCPEPSVPRFASTFASACAATSCSRDADVVSSSGFTSLSTSSASAAAADIEIFCSCTTPENNGSAQADRCSPKPCFPGSALLEAPPPPSCCCCCCCSHSPGPTAELTPTRIRSSSGSPPLLAVTPNRSVSSDVSSSCSAYKSSNVKYCNTVNRTYVGGEVGTRTVSAVSSASTVAIDKPPEEYAWPSALGFTASVPISTPCAAVAGCRCSRSTSVGANDRLPTRTPGCWSMAWSCPYLLRQYAGISATLHIVETAFNTRARSAAVMRGVHTFKECESPSAPPVTTSPYSHMSSADREVICVSWPAACAAARTGSRAAACGISTTSGEVRILKMESASAPIAVRTS